MKKIRSRNKDTMAREKLQPLVSVIVPVYNVKEYVEKCIKTLVFQTYKNIEILIIDDGSNDGSEKICDELGLEDKRIRIIHKKNGGLSSARNMGIKKAKGDLIVFVDSDDFVKKDYVEKLQMAIEKEDADIVVCGYNNVIPKEQVMTGKAATIKLLTLQENLDVVAWNKMYKRELFIKNNIEFPEGEKYEDTLTTYKILSVAKKVVYISSALYEYVTRSTSIMGESKVQERLMARERASREAMSFLQYDQDLTQAAEFSLLLAKYAFLDAAIRKDIDKKYIKKNIKWIKENIKQYKNNKFVTKKVKIYNLMIMSDNGIFYKLFRRIRHE